MNSDKYYGVFETQVKYWKTIYYLGPSSRAGDDGGSAAGPASRVPRCLAWLVGSLVCSFMSSQSPYLSSTNNAGFLLDY